MSQEPVQLTPLAQAGTVPPLPHGTTQGVGQRIDEGKGRIFPCEKCGADLKFEIGQQSLQCPYCGWTKSLMIDRQAVVAEQDYLRMLEHLADCRRQGRTGETKNCEIRCESCGATVAFSGTLTSSECACCGSPLQREKVYDAPDRVPVDGVLPFLVEQKRAQENLRQWANSRWFAPSQFRMRGVQGRFNGIYLPYWTFDTLTFNRYSGQRGDNYTVQEGEGENRRTVTRVRWSSVSGEFQRFFDDVLVCAAAGMPKALLQSLEPWALGQCIPFNQQVLAGFLAQTYALPLDHGFQEAKQRIDGAIANEVRTRIGGDQQRIDSIRTHHDAISYKYLLLPVWLLAYRYQDKLYQVVVNASTGEVQGERPYSWIKITLAVLGVAAAIAAVFLLTRS